MKEERAGLSGGLNLNILKGEVPGVIIDDARHPPKNATVKNFTSSDFLGPIKFDSPNGGTSNSLIKKECELSL